MNLIRQIELIIECEHAVSTDIKPKPNHATIRAWATMLAEEITGMTQARILADTDYKLMVSSSDSKGMVEMDVQAANDFANCKIAGGSPRYIIEGPEDTKIANRLCDWVQRLVANEPIQYILGHTTFAGINLLADRRTLIPRPETETLVEMAVNRASRWNGRAVIGDLCTGSGCISIALAKLLPEADIFAWDISRDALDQARQNAWLNGVSNNILFSRKDILTDDLEVSDTTIVVSNPPYILPREQQYMAPNVLDYEPHDALFVPEEDPLLYYRAIARFATSNETECVLLEINPLLRDNIIDLFQNQGYKLQECKQDFNGIVRFLAFEYVPQDD